MNKFKVVSAFLILASIWGGAFVAIKIVVTSFPPIHSILIRLIIATPFLWILFKTRKQKLTVPRSMLLRVWMAGLLMIGIPYCLVGWGETKTPAALGGIINGMVPLWTVLGSCLTFWGVAGDRKALDSQVILGLILGFAGLIVIFLPQIDLHAISEEAWGTLAITGMAFCYGISNVLNARILKASNGVTIAGNVFQQHLVSLGFLLIAAPLLEPQEIDWSLTLQPSFIIGIIYLGILSGATAQIFYYYLIREIGAIKTSAITYLIPITSIFFDFVILKSIPSGMTFLGTAGILAGIFFIRRSTTAV